MNLPSHLLFTVLLLTASSFTTATPMVNIAVADDGYYELTFDALDLLATVETMHLRLYERGRPVPMRVADGDDGVFGPGDSIHFVGRRVAGKHSWYHQYSRHNNYQLHTSRPTAGSQPVRHPAALAGPIVLHLERDLLRTALPDALQPQQVDHWYWQRLTHLAGDSFRQELTWADPPRAIRVALAGLSRDKNASAAGLPQHQVQVSLDGKVAGEASWDGQESVVIEVSDPELLGQRDGGSTLEISVAARNIENGDLPIIDAVLLNWIEVEFSPEARVQGLTMVARDGVHRLLVPDAAQSPSRVFKAGPAANLNAVDRQADYLMITHESLQDALRPLADYHRGQNLNVLVVDAQDIYDEFNHGIKSPVAIRDFVSHAWHRWQRPAPRMVLLAGDASWAREADTEESRDLVPTLQAHVRGQLAASDNGLVAIDGNDWWPDLAVGRLPASTPQQMIEMVDRILQYSAGVPDGDWRARATFIADSDPIFQTITRQLATEVIALDLNAQRIFPADNDREGADDQTRVVEAFDNGSALVHFLGHGGRFVWRTGPQDLRGATDLFGVENIESLASNRRLPLVLSMTCSSGPFDHPTADSIAEAFLRSQQRGAIGVLAASWRVPASQRFSSLLINALLEKGERIGEAILKAKREERRRTLVESYNLLGDPAMMLAIKASS